MASGGSTELASAYLALIPSLKGSAKQIEAQLSGINVSSVGRSMGSTLGSKISSGLASAAAVGVKAIGAIGGAVVGLAATGGISRALKIDQATMMFENMGISVEEALASCNEAVTGTAYGLDAAAQVAASLAASGVSMGDGMTSSLKAVAGMAAMSGRSMEDVGIIFGKVAAQGKLQGDELMQFAESGINATAALANYLGVTQTEARELVKKGVIDFQTFSDAMYATFGDAAQGANETFTGAMSNVQAALSRIGAKFATPGLESLRKVFVALIPAIDQVSKLLDPVVEAFTAFAEQASTRAVTGINAFTETLQNTGSVLSAFREFMLGAFDGTAIGTLTSKMFGFAYAVQDGVDPVALLKNYMQELGDYASGVLAPAIEKFNSVMENTSVKAGAFAAATVGAFAVLNGPITAVAAALAKVAPWILKVKDFFIVLGAYVAQCGGGLLGVGRVLLAVINPVTVAVGVIAILVAGFMTLMSTNEEFRSSIMGLVGQIGSSLAPILSMLGQMVSNLASTVVPLVTGIINMFIPIIGQIVTIILQVIAALAPLVTMIMATLIPMLTILIQDIANIAAMILSAVVPVISLILSLIQSVMPVIVSIITAAMNVVLGVVQTVWPLIQTAIESAMAIIQSVIAVITAAIEGDWDAVWSAIGQLFSDIWDGITAFLDSALTIASDLLSTALAWISEQWSSLWTSVSSFFSQKWDEITNALGDKVEEVLEFFRNLPQNILDALGDLGSLLWDAGKSIISGLVGGASAWWDEKKEFFSGIATWIKNNKGPKEYDLKLLVPNGGWIMQSLITGFEKGMPALKSTLSSITDEVSRGLQPDFSSMSSNHLAFEAAGGRGGYSGDTYTFGDINITAQSLEDVATIEQFVSMLKRARQVNPVKAYGRG